MIPVGMAVQQKKELDELKSQLTGPFDKANQFFSGSIEQLVPKGTPGATPDTDKVTFNAVAKDAVNNPASLWALAAIIVVSPLLIRQIRGWGYDITDATKEVYNEGKTQIRGAGEQARYVYARGKEGYTKAASAPSRRG
ncbi:hypothetical protein [Deinococcus misasensis]|uniref:hypothetical protein n=1 Tax=Deinococcus misasensis TaxID=392413 RepID=UPI0012F8C29D|nr:hypothetical protein [Deinococcus misasensis]